MIINFSNIGTSGGGSGSGVTPQQVQQQIDSALTPYWDSAATEDAIEESASALSTDISFISARTQTNEEVLAVAVNDINSIQDSMSAYTLTADTAALSGVVQEQQIVFSSGYNELHTQVMELSGRTEDIGFLSNRVQTNEQVLATAVNDVNDMKIRFSAYTPTTGFSTINGSAVTNGGNLVIEGGAGDMDKLLPISGLPVSAEVGTVVSCPSSTIGTWTRGNTSGITYYFTITDTTGQLMTAATIAVITANTIISIDIEYSGSSWYWSGHPIVNDGARYDIADWYEGETHYTLFITFTENNKLRLRFDPVNRGLKDIATISTLYEPVGGDYNLFKYNGTEWEEVGEYTLPVATSQSLGGVKVPSYEEGYPLYIADGLILLDTSRISISEADTSNQTKSVLVNWEIDRNDPTVYEPGYVLNIPFFSLSASVSFKSSELAEHYGDVPDNELFGTTYAPNQEEPHLHLYYNKAEEQDPYYTFDDLEETGDMPRFDLVDGTSAFTFTVTGSDGNEYTYTANVTVANGDDISVVITIHNDSEDKDAEVDIWSGEIEMGAPITLNGSPEIALAKFGREFDPDLGDAVQKWSKYYNEDNIGEAGLVKNEGGVSGIWKGTQAQYDTLTQSGATADPNTLYVIIPTV